MTLTPSLLRGLLSTGSAGLGPSADVLCASLGSTLSTRASKRRRPLSSSSSYSTSSANSSKPPTTLVDPKTYMTDLLQQTDRTSYLISHFFPQPHHHLPYLALRAFNAELAQVRESVSNEILGRIRMGWWRDAIRALYASVEHSRGGGEAARRVPAHPVLKALHSALLDPVLQSTPSTGLLQSEHHLQAIISAREDDLASSASAPSLDSIERYAERTSSRLAYLELDLLGVRDEQMDEVCSHIGKARGLANLLASIPFHARMMTRSGGGSKDGQRRLTLPQEYLIKRDVVEEEVYRLGPDAPGLRDAIFDTATRANDYLISARTALSRAQFPGARVPAVLYPVLVGAVPAQNYLKRLEGVNFDVFEPGLQVSGWKLSWALWRTSRTGRF
ncbi:hypothetical protein CF319_g6043 [Tilletia indica]|nr:hypothetical protein CF319_g6043 [Tilletia indica]